MSAEYETFSLGDWTLKNGGTIPDAHIAYKTFGDPSSPLIIYPSWYSGSIADNEWLIGEDKTLNPKVGYLRHARDDADLSLSTYRSILSSSQHCLATANRRVRATSPI